MALMIFCPGCRTRQLLVNDRPGQSILCPGCGAVMAVPLAEPPLPPEPPPLPPEPPYAFESAETLESPGDEPAEQSYAPGLAPPGAGPAEHNDSPALSPPAAVGVEEVKPAVITRVGRRFDPLASRRKEKNRRARRRLFAVIGLALAAFIGCCIMVPLAWGKMQEYWDDQEKQATERKNEPLPRPPRR